MSPNLSITFKTRIIRPKAVIDGSWFGIFQNSAHVNVKLLPWYHLAAAYYTGIIE